ncbi:MAG TPA: heparan-alpha-glucosaminide N-acetyltransferase domain-containing protein [Pseudolabrys sp.]|jgi:uncharacterized membrane protein
MTVVLDASRRTVLSRAAPSQAPSADVVVAGTRLNSIDTLRGLVMIVMALDHTRDFFANGGFNPRDVTDTALFLTRWVTHFCAPTFIFLAGISAYLYCAQRRSTADVSRFLVTRGLWLVLIEFTVVRVGWSFDLHFNYFVAQVIFAIGISMVALSALVHLPRGAIAVIGLAMIAGHNALDGIKAEQLGAAAPLWHILHQPGLFDIAPGVKFFVLYPLVPWIGVMAAGYALGPVFMQERVVRVRQLSMLGAVVILAFVVLRATNLYGDPAPWAIQDTLAATVLSFINCEKYPPSLLFLAMTLGPALMLVAAFERVRGPVGDWVATFGRVPFFYYVVHIFLLHALAVLFAWLSIGDIGWLFGPPGHKPAAYGLPLAGIYAVWLMVVVALYPLCRWFAGIKNRRTEWWWSYL